MGGPGLVLEPWALDLGSRVSGFGSPDLLYCWLYDPFVCEVALIGVCWVAAVCDVADHPPADHDDVVRTVAPNGTCKAQRGMCHVRGDTRAKERPKKGRGLCEERPRRKQSPSVVNPGLLERPDILPVTTRRVCFDLLRPDCSQNKKKKKKKSTRVDTTA